MDWLDQNIGWILIVSGAATCSMIAMALAPRWTARFLFQEDLMSPSSLLIARSWGAMIFASGLMLIYAAEHPEARVPILLYSIAGKLGFVFLTVGNGHYARRPAMIAAAGDVIIVLLLAMYIAARQQW